MSFDIIQKSRPILIIMNIFGLWTNNNDDDDNDNGVIQRKGKIPKISPTFFRHLMHVPFTFMFVLLMWLDLIFSSDLTQAVDVLYIALTLTAMLAKFLNACYYRALTKSMFKEWQTNEMFELKTLQEHLMWQRSSKKFGRHSFFYIMWCMCVCVGDSLKVVFMNTYQLSYQIYIPFNWQHPVYYWYAYFYELFAMGMSCLVNVTLDMFYCYMVQHLTLCFKLIAMRLENLGMKKSETDEQITQTLRDIIKLEQKVRRMSQQCEAVVSFPILMQILLSAFVICFSLYRVHTINFLENPGYFLSSIQYAFAITLQIFLLCYYGDQLTVASSNLPNSINNCNWIEMSAHNRKLIFCYIQYIQKPVILKAGYYFEVGLPIFAKTINNAYSFFALLLNMDEE